MKLKNFKQMSKLTANIEECCVTGRITIYILTFESRCSYWNICFQRLECPRISIIENQYFINTGPKLNNFVAVGHVIHGMMAHH